MKKTSIMNFVYDWVSAYLMAICMASTVYFSNYSFMEMFESIAVVSNIMLIVIAVAIMFRIKYERNQISMG